MREIVILSEDAEDLIEALRVLKDCQAAATAVQTRDVVQRARTSSGEATGVVLFLTERDNVAELRMLLRQSNATVLLVAPTSPPRASLARVANEYGTGLCSRLDSATVREALLVVLAAGKSERAVS